MRLLSARQRSVLCEQVIGAAREMHRRGLVIGTVGNVSARFGDRMLITPTRREYAALRRRDIVEVELHGGMCNSGRGHASGEWPLHAAVYRARPDIAAIVHTHSPYAAARSFNPAPIVVQTEECVYLGLTEIAVSDWQPAGSHELAAAAVAALGRRPAALLARHGVLATDSSPRAALEIAAAVERQAQIDWLLSHDSPQPPPMFNRRSAGDPPRSWPGGRAGRR
jgi:L-fuculose-phosphate aldolase